MDDAQGAVRMRRRRRKEDGRAEMVKDRWGEGGEEQQGRDWKWGAEKSQEIGTQGVFQRKIKGKQRGG